MVICLELGADLHMAQRMPLPLTVSCFSKIQIGFTFLVLAYPASPGKKGPLNVCLCVFYDCFRGEPVSSFLYCISLQVPLNGKMHCLFIWPLCKQYRVIFYMSISVSSLSVRMIKLSCQ